jgi:hypothetical protein
MPHAPERPIEREADFYLISARWMPPDHAAIVDPWHTKIHFRKNRRTLEKQLDA